MSLNTDQLESPVDETTVETSTETQVEAENGESSSSDKEDDLDPVAEGEAPPPEQVQPSCKKANDLKFFAICKRLEKLWQLRRDKKQLKRSVTDLERKKALLPPELLLHLSTPEQPGGPPESIFPLFRLLLPDKDSSRSFLMKETALIKAYSSAFNLQSSTADKLLHYKNAQLVQDPKAVGDLSAVLRLVLDNRIVYDTTGKTGSDWTIGEINAQLDRLASLPHQARANKDAYERQKQMASTATADNNGASISSSAQPKKPLSVSELRVRWVQNMSKPPSGRGRKALTPLEHKWLVRIIQQRMEFGIGWRGLLTWYNEHAIALYDAHTSLKAICRILCDPQFSTGLYGRRSQSTDEAASRTDLSSYMPSSMGVLTFGKPFTPMGSARTSFDRMLDDVSRRHRTFAKAKRDEATSRNEKPHPAAQSLSFRNPPFAVETKLDGERMIVHMSQDGIVKIHSRQGNWYSRSYSPVLGPALRRATSKYKLDLVLDGEILSWDSVREETIPFGQNRTVAKLRHSSMKRNGEVDNRDMALHDDDSAEGDAKVMRTSHISNSRNDPSEYVVGDECWLVYFAFDVMYIDGPDAAKLLEETVSPHIQPRPVPGPISDLDGIERKKLLFKLIDVQENEVVIVPTWVVRPTGQTVLGADYFSPDHPTTECSHRATDLDSLNWTLKQDTLTVQKLDEERRMGKSDEQISQARSWAANQLYGKMVEDQRMEGLLFKDLSAPYCLGEESKSFAYWHKFKPDYYNGSVASDLDVLIIGAYFASGLRHAGRPSSFLCACVDSDDSERFFTLCKVNAGSMKRQVLDDLFKSTGYMIDENTGRVDQGDRWFVEEDRKTVPDFVTSRSHQSGVHEGWRFKKIDYPDMWIHPKDSRIVTLNAGEIVATNFFSAGITLRFPRVTALRSRSDKAPSEVDSEATLWEIYRKHVEDRSEAQFSQNIASPSMQQAALSHRFLTEEQYADPSKKKMKPSSRRKLFKVATVDEPEMIDSDALQGLAFTVLDGVYHLDEDETAIDLDEAIELGWLEEAKSVNSSTDVKCFILKHGGKVKIAPNGNELVIGGCVQDARISAYIRAVENARRKVDERKGKAASTKTAQLDDKMAQSAGVLHWTFLFSLVYRKLAGKSSEQDLTLRATVFDYIGRPSRNGADSLFVDLCSEEIKSARNLKRALDLVGKSPHEDKDQLSWQRSALTKLTPDERWAVGGRLQTLWPYKRGESPAIHHVIVYPDIFDYTTKSFWDPSTSGADSQVEETTEDAKCVLKDFASSKIASVLPLARAMGAIVSSQLDADVTHVLCDLRADDDEVTFTNDLDEEAFAEPCRGRNLLKRLSALQTGKSNSTEIMLVSPKWIRKRKWNT